MSTKRMYIIENNGKQTMFLEKPDSSDEEFAIGDEIEMIVLDEIEQERIYPNEDAHEFIDHSEHHREYCKERTLFDSMRKKGLLKQIF